MRGDGHIAAIDELIAVGDELGFVDVLRVAGLAVENGLAGCGVAVCAGYRDCVAESPRTETIKSKVLRVARQVPEILLLAFPREPVGASLVKARGGLVVDGAGGEDVLILFRGIVGNVIKVPGVGYADGGDAVMHGAANLSCAIERPADIGRPRGHVKLIVGQIICRLQPTDSAEIVELFVCAG